MTNTNKATIENQDLLSKEIAFQDYTAKGIPAERQTSLDNISARHLERTKRIVKRTAATVFATLVAGAGVAVLKATDGPTHRANHPNQTIKLENVNGIQGSTEVISYDDATRAQQDESNYIAEVQK